MWQPEQTLGCVRVYRNTAVLLTSCVTAWIGCWLCDTVQKYCCTVNRWGGGGVANSFSSDSSFSSLSLSSSQYFQLLYILHCRKSKYAQSPTLYSIYYIYCSTFIVISQSALPKIINVSDKICLEIQKRHFIINNFFENRAIFLDNVEQYGRGGRPHITIWDTHKTCSITKATNTLSEYVILIAFPLQQWLHESAKMLHYTHIACLATISCK